MEWIVKIEGEEEKNQRIRIRFSPITETIFCYGECRVKNNKWDVFSRTTHGMKISSKELQNLMEETIIIMRKRLEEYNNLNKGFTVLKWIAFEERE